MTGGPAIFGFICHQTPLSGSSPSHRPPSSVIYVEIYLYLCIILDPGRFLSLKPHLSQLTMHWHCSLATIAFLSFLLCFRSIIRRQHQSLATISILPLVLTTTANSYPPVYQSLLSPGATARCYRGTILAFGTVEPYGL